MTNPNATTAAGRHRAPDVPGRPASLAGDTTEGNPVNDYPANVFPLGAAITIAYGTPDNIFCTLGNLYRIIGYLTGDLPAIDGDPNADPPIPSLADEWARCSEHVAAQLPTGLAAAQTVDPEGKMAWLTNAMAAHGDTVDLTPMPEAATNE